ncbi:hypothetical protein niasHT_007994 [Heterodera trifolii]|uniref:Uncharacterized protein n=1 Tax=Heterodera trifolii TaxID=157864 RepID=A0ABD2M0S1_9BILA
MPSSIPLICPFELALLFLLSLCHFLPSSSAAVSSFPPFSSSSSSSGDLFDPLRMPMPNDRPFLPIDQQVFPHFQNVQQSVSGNGIGGAGGGAMDLESWSKNQAVRLNQQNAVVAQLAQMAPHRRNQLTREMANGNATAANELVTRLMRDLAATQHGLMAFPHLAFAAEPQTQSINPAFLGALRTTSPSPVDSPFFAQQSVGTMPIARQIQLAQQRQFLLNSAGNVPPPFSSSVFPSGSTFNSAGSFDQRQPSSFGQFGPSTNDRFQPLNSQMSPNAFAGVSSADLSRPNSLFSSTAPSSIGQTQITPFSQSFLSSNNANKFATNGENERTLSGAEFSGQPTARENFRGDFDRKDGTFQQNGKGFVTDVMTMDDILGRRMAMAGGGEGTAERSEETRKGLNNRRWKTEEK